MAFTLKRALRKAHYSEISGPYASDEASLHIYLVVVGCPHRATFEDHLLLPPL